MIQEKEEILKELQASEEENKRLLDLLIKHSKGDKVNMTGSQDQESIKKQGNYNNNQKGVLSEQEDFSNYNINTNLVNISMDKQNTNNSQKQGMQNKSNQNNKDNGMSTVIGASGKTLTLKQLKDFIEEIYESKMKFDQKALENKLPRETMEQHMYTFLNQKYGLKSLIIEWATSIINGIRKFSQEDNDVAVFGKILRNECDEEFRFVQGQVKNTISELLKVIYIYIIFIYIYYIV